MEIGGRGGTEKERKIGRVLMRRISVTIVGNFMYKSFAVDVFLILYSVFRVMYCIVSFL